VSVALEKGGGSAAVRRASGYGIACEKRPHRITEAMNTHSALMEKKGGGLSFSRQGMRSARVSRQIQLQTLMDYPLVYNPEPYAWRWVRITVPRIGEPITRGGSKILMRTADAN
jgi:hypothetical protein